MRRNATISSLLAIGLTGCTACQEAAIPHHFTAAEEVQIVEEINRTPPDDPLRAMRSDWEYLRKHANVGQ